MDKRKHKRFIVENMDIHAKTLLTTEIELLDISLGGACIKSSKSLNIGGNYLIKLQNENIIIPIKCTVVWEKLSGSLYNDGGDFIPMYTAGLKFKDVSIERLEDLKDFIGRFDYPEEKKISDEKRLSGLRFKIITREKVSLKYQNTNIVKEISLGGILVETNYEIPAESKLPMELSIPGEDHPIKFYGRVAFCTDVTYKEPKSFNIGIEFLDMKEDDKSILSKFIQFLSEI